MKKISKALLSLSLALFLSLSLPSCAEQKEPTPPEQNRENNESPDENTDAVPDGDQSNGGNTDIPGQDETQTGGETTDDPSENYPALLEKSFSASGRFISDTGTKLNLYIDWCATAERRDEITLSLVVGLESYSLYVGERRELGELCIGEVNESFSTPALKITEDHKKTYTELYTFERTYTPKSDGSFGIALSASWFFNGTYNETKLGTLECDGKISLNISDESAE